MGRGYRSDVDGLRALSVLAVLFFHADLWVPGGFVGVDVFFVISGYLITGLIASELDAGRFSMARFWERRLRRIWPAALAVTIAVLVAGWWLMLPGDYRALAGDAVAQVTMAANVRYWLGTDYFSGASDLRPLLHTWSLAVEEQFYVLYPLLLVGLWRLARRHVFQVLTCVMLLSLAASVLMLERSASGAFYLLPYRAWELQLGGLIALLPPSVAIRGRWRDALGLVGITAIVWSCFAYDRTTPFPGLAAIPPCLGAALVVLACDPERSIVGRLLGSPPLRAIGLISYSLYLWHWPILAFVRYRWGLELNATSAVCSILASFMCASLSYRWIETPFRRGLQDWRLPQVASAALVATLLPLGAGVAIRRFGGFPARIDPSVAAFLASQDLPRKWDLDVLGAEDLFIPIGAGQSHDRPPCFLFLGDSHGTALSAVIDRAASARSLAGSASLRGAFAPLPGVWRPGARSPDRELEAHRAFDAALEQELRDGRYRHVVLCARWSGYLSDGRTDVGDAFRIAAIPDHESSGVAARAAMVSGLRRLLDMTAAADCHVWVLLEVPFQPIDPHRRGIDAMFGGSLSLDGASRAEHEARVGEVRAVVAEASRSAPGRLHVIDLAEPIFGGSSTSRVGRPGIAWYFDDDHLSPAGAEEIAGGAVSGMIERIAGTCAPGVPGATSAPAP